MICTQKRLTSVVTLFLGWARMGEDTHFCFCPSQAGSPSSSPRALTQVPLEVTPGGLLGLCRPGSSWELRATYALAQTSCCPLPAEAGTPHPPTHIHKTGPRNHWVSASTAKPQSSEQFHQTLSVLLGWMWIKVTFWELLTLEVCFLLFFLGCAMQLTRRCLNQRLNLGSQV